MGRELLLKYILDYSPVEKVVLCYKVDRLVALLPTFPSVCCLQYDVCKPLMPDIVAPEAHQNGCLHGDGRLPRTIRYIYQMYRAMYASDTGLGKHYSTSVHLLASKT